MAISLFLQRQVNILQLQNHGEVLRDLITQISGMAVPGPVKLLRWRILNIQILMGILLMDM